MYTFKRSYGFTLIELMIAVAVIGILAAIAYPSYTSYVIKAKRSDAKAALLQVQLAQEKYRANHVTYATTLADIGFLPPPASLCVSTVPVSPDCHYTIAIVGTPTATTYTVTAAPLLPFADATCDTFAVNQAGKTTTTGTDSVQTTPAKVTECWGK